MRQMCLGMILTLALLVSGCAEYSYWFGRTFYGVDCRPQAAATNNGKCIYLKEKGSGNAPTQTAHP